MFDLVVLILLHLWLARVCVTGGKEKQRRGKTGETRLPDRHAGHLPVGRAKQGRACFSVECFPEAS